MHHKETYEKGLALLNQMHGGQAGQYIVETIGSISPELRDMTIEWAFGEVVSREGIDQKTRELTIIAACITHGALMPQLRAHYESALKIGVTQQEIIEVILQMVFYAGMAAATNAMHLAKEVFDAFGED